jgi:signal peptidase II
VDMLYFPLIDGHFPQWVPIWGGEEFMFFRPIFNIADSSISIGVIALLVFQSKFSKKEASEVNPQPQTENLESSSSEELKDKSNFELSGLN